MNLSWKNYGILLFLAVLGIQTLFSAQQGLEPSNVLTVAFLDVGQGDAIYIRTPLGNDMLVDGGPTGNVIQKLQEVIPSFDNNLDVVVATHPDKDHIAGLIPVFDEFDVHYFLTTARSSDSSYDESLIEASENEPGLETVIAQRGQRILLDKQSGVVVDVLFPDRDTNDFEETNESSIILKITYGEQTFLLTGDAPISVEQFLARADPASLESDVLKLGHHGSATSSSDEFLDAVQPKFTVVSAGKNNSYHHPSASVIERINARSIPILSTIDNGTIIFKTNGIDLWNN